MQYTSKHHTKCFYILAFGIMFIALSNNVIGLKYFHVILLSIPGVAKGKYFESAFKSRGQKFTKLFRLMDLSN